VPRVADADSQAPEIPGPELRRYVLEAVVTGDAAPELHLRFAREQVELVVDDKDLGRRNGEKAGRRRYRPSREVHVRHRLQKAQIAARLGEQPLEFAFAGKRRTQSRRQRIDKPEPRVVPSERILTTRVAKAGDKAHCGLAFSAGHERSG